MFQKFKTKSIVKKLIRKGVYETNSSSSHSIALATEDKEFVLDTIYPNQNGIITVHGDEYGWEWFKNNDSETKASYAAQSFANDDDQLDVLKEVIMEQTGADDVIFEGLNDGYIDHDSYGIVPRSKDELKNFIFNKNSWLFGGNDNSSPDPTFYHVPEIRDGKMIQPVYKFELSIEGLGRTTKFLTEPSEEELGDAISTILDDSLLTEGGDFITDNSIMWQITRSKDFYKLSYNITQDYKSNEVIFIKESFSTYSLNKQYEKEMEGMNWEDKGIFISNKILEIPGVTKKVKFTLKEI
jgi:hypothetical protein